ncbi:MAG: hypothetical protein CVU05_00890 [Bacteroidetes bacterium HGW-Bacteroidetes-21]|nr:MAG: hypothetical protein CVU05_00890 [Bacteroidetes bacterium HGW-Bacteroidetes-21]
MKKYIILFLAFFASIVAHAQVAINTTGAVPNASSALDIDFTNRGLLIPRVALTAANAAGPVAAPANSLLVYNTATAGASPNNVWPGYYYWETATSTWKRVLEGKDAWMTTGNTGTTAPTSGYGVVINNNFVGTNDAVDFTFGTNSYERMRIKSDANGNTVRVGIGTSYATAYPSGLTSTLLHVFDAGNTATDFGQFQLGANKTTAGSKVGEINFHSALAATDRRTASIESYITAVSGLNPMGDLRFFTNNSTSATFSEKMRIQGDGYVGIGTTAPAYNLDITGNTRTTGKYFGHLNVDDTRAVNDAPTAFNNEVAFEFKTRATVGVGGSGTYSGQMTIAPWGDNSGDASHQLNFNEGGIFWRQGQPDAATWDPWVQILTAGMAPSGSGTLNYIPKWTPNGTTLGNSQFYDNGTNVGLGNTTPSQKLHITGNTLTTGDMFVNSATTGTFHWGTAGLLGSASSFNPNLGSAGLWIEGSQDGESGGLFMNGNTMCLWSPGDNDILRVYDEDIFGSGPQMVLNSGGYLGVGLNLSPAERIHSSENIRADGIVYWGNGLARTETRNNAGLRGDAGARSGFFETDVASAANNYPTGSSGWWHLIDSRHSNNGNNYAMQIAGSFFDQFLWYRKTSDNAAQAWKLVLATSGPGNAGQALVSQGAGLEPTWNGVITPSHIYSVESTASITLTSSFQVVTGESVTITGLATGDRVLINYSGNALMSSSDHADVDVAAFVNGGMIAIGGYTRFSLDWSGTNYLGWQNFSSVARYTIPSNGDYTFDVRALRSGGSGTIYVGGNSSQAMEGVLIIYVLKN